MPPPVSNHKSFETPHLVTSRSVEASQAGGRVGFSAPLVLQDHARPILEAVAADLRTAQSVEEQARKSMGLAPVPFPARETAAETHAVLRAKSGYHIRQLVAEYRALRSSVLSLWADASSPTGADLQDVIRFGEAIDQAVAESVPTSARK